MSCLEERGSGLYTDPHPPATRCGLPPGEYVTLGNGALFSFTLKVDSGQNVASSTTQLSWKVWRGVDFRHLVLHTGGDCFTLAAGHRN